MHGGRVQRLGKEPRKPRAPPLRHCKQARGGLLEQLVEQQSDQ